MTQHHTFRRRTLLQAATVGCAAIVSSRSLGAPGRPAPSDRITLGFIGTGGRGTSLLRSFLPLKLGRVLAVCDCLADRRNRARSVAGQQYGGASGIAATGDFREILARDDIDAVVLAPQDHWHGVIATAAARAGKDIYCEKPLGVSVAECEAIRRAVRSTGRVFQTGTQQRSVRNFRFACELARSGYLGKVHRLEVGAPGPHYRPKYRGPLGPQPVPKGFDYNMFVGPAAWAPYNPARIDWPGWYLIWDYCAGFIVNWGVHHLDIACWGCPEITRQPFDVRCEGTYRTEGLTDNINGWRGRLAFEGGVEMIFSDTGHPVAQGCKFVGPEGWVHVNRRGIWAEPASLLAVKLGTKDVHLHTSLHHQGDFLDAVRTRRDPVSPVESGQVASELGLLAEIACRVRKPLRWDPHQRLFAHADEANRRLVRPHRGPWHL